MIGQSDSAPKSPPDRTGRSGVARSVWLGAAIVIAGLVVLAAGLLSNHRLSGNQDQAIPQWRLVELVTHGGVKRSEPAATSQTTQPGTAAKIEKVEQPPSQCPT